ncbi:aromatic amino acid ammonia-lyase [Acinetobacter baumannii]|uniref:HAL/PAL/TAL family ammonia-lyase n=1 Tax=Acinetobacter baumannii TaxID=470 RepID=UPI0021BE90B6|nr:aromatic amino acid ammonia-lyase [Acinetobacter baumannii]MCT9288855.1 aromatic amino acid ammonia-lyase [Acinetobacter baumannii]MCV2390404.1 aromatic amino acid ammonia-lyase [Acinetobacter baumannii]MDC4271468.1 aromatic amino acid ammonia-lyase [Acinetobacter baumannii]MDC4583487.1 aromatic amino acid ammonia-lyase [Acinetobacter baumannii]MDC4919253.1 aromatic amino acid ammonia-lyase [Acinetobacter baumannii]
MRVLTVGEQPLSIEDVVSVARGECQVALPETSEWRELIQKGADFLDQLLEEEGVIYGVTTGYGDSCLVEVPLHQVNELPLHLSRFHGCGLGENLDVIIARAVVVTRLCSLARGYSGVSIALLERLVWLLNENVIPVIPSEGSVGASGDLTPLSYIAGTLVGERDVYIDGQIVPVAQVYAEKNMLPLTLRPKEGLALMNGTAVMTAIACLNYKKAEQIALASTLITALNVLALEGNPSHFDEILFAQKPHPGQQHIAKQLRDWLNSKVQTTHQSPRLQDRYSLRCAPHIIGVFEDSKVWLRQFIENELNSSNDNPLIDPVGMRVLHGGHFYGGHIAQAMDSLKIMIANIADLMDRQIAQLVDHKMNYGLPRNLTGATAERLPLNHGFKAVQIGVSAWTAEALKNTLAASIFSRSTECHNQDKVSMGTIAARDASRVITLTQQVIAALCCASVQAIHLKGLTTQLSPTLQTFMQWTLQSFAFVEEDRPLQTELQQIVNRLDQLELFNQPEFMG